MNAHRALTCPRGQLGRPLGSAVVQPAAQQHRAVRCCFQAAQQQQQQQPVQPVSAVDEALQEAQSLFESIKAAGGAAPMGYPGYPGYVCDNSGCVLAVEQHESPNATTPPFQHMLSGPNWKLGMVAREADPLYSDMSESPDSSMDGDGLLGYTPASASGSTHAACIAGPGWHVFMSAHEFAAYVHMLGQLRMAVASLRFQGLWNAGSSTRPPSRARWAGPDVRLTAVFAPGEPGFSVESTFLYDDGRGITTHLPADVTAALVAELDETMGFRPLAVRGT